MNQSGVHSDKKSLAIWVLFVSAVLLTTGILWCWYTSSSTVAPRPISPEELQALTASGEASSTPPSETELNTLTSSSTDSNPTASETMKSLTAEN